MKVLALSMLLVGAALGKSTKGNAAYTYVYSEADQNGSYQLFTDYAPDLRAKNFDNTIKSVFQSGMWLYYENVQYNEQPGKVYWVHGIEISMDLPFHYQNMCSSLRFVGSANYHNVDSWTLYEGSVFTGNELHGESDARYLGSLSRKASSLILTGTSPWTFYDGYNFSGHGVCVYPNTDTDLGSNGKVLNYGIFPNIHVVGLTDNSVSSVRKGCWSKNVVKAKPLEAKYRGTNGAWGILES